MMMTKARFNELALEFSDSWPSGASVGFELLATIDAQVQFYVTGDVINPGEEPRHFAYMDILGAKRDLLAMPEATRRELIELKARQGLAAVSCQMATIPPANKIAEAVNATLRELGRPELPVVKWNYRDLVTTSAIVFPTVASIDLDDFTHAPEPDAIVDSNP